jgi:hypothetical protein
MNDHFRGMIRMICGNKFFSSDLAFKLTPSDAEFLHVFRCMSSNVTMQCFSSNNLTDQVFGGIQHDNGNNPRESRAAMDAEAIVTQPLNALGLHFRYYSFRFPKYAPLAQMMLYKNFLSMCVPTEGMEFSKFVKTLTASPYSAQHLYYNRVSNYIGLFC